MTTALSTRLAAGVTTEYLRDLAGARRDEHGRARAPRFARDRRAPTARRTGAHAARRAPLHR